MHADTDLVDTVEFSDRELIAQVRAGDQGAFGVLYERHRDVALRVAIKLSAGSSLLAEDCVADAFAKTLAALQEGKGPEEFFRSYIYTVMRNAVHAANRADSQSVLVDDFEIIERDRKEPFVDPAVTRFETQVVRTAFSAIPEQWQSVLWYSDVEGMKPAEVAPLLGLSPHGVSMLRTRAREGLRTAYLQAHLSEVPSGSVCAGIVPKLGLFGRNSAPKRDLVKIDAHLVECPNCSSMAAEVKDINRGLILIIGPLFLGGSATLIFGSGTLAPTAPLAAAASASSSATAGAVALAPSAALPATVAGAAAVSAGVGSTPLVTERLVAGLRNVGITSVPRAVALAALAGVAALVLVVVPAVLALPFTGTGTGTGDAETETSLDLAHGAEIPGKKALNSEAPGSPQLPNAPERPEISRPLVEAELPGAFVPVLPLPEPQYPSAPAIPPVVVPPLTPVEVVSNGGFGGAGFDFRNGSYRIGEQFDGWTVLTAQPGLGLYGLQVWSTSLNNEGAISGEPYPNGPWAGVQGSLSQTISTETGKTYRLSYLTRASASTPWLSDSDWKGGTQGGVKVDGVVVDTFETVAKPGFSLREVTFTAKSDSTEVVFFSVARSVGIDDVSIKLAR